ncbi:hypothetical protein Hypma_006128 [Hypsizygus marmoreus]|uniref:Uncharacterized protein n=1 Tax=Hypsizygus marmoreus TaxID=39966 RepID=A0A369JYL1_HYPMA|nr:hypothetical protein Hypma_006128 [Hypsizygus marmoreus]
MVIGDCHLSYLLFNFVEAPSQSDVYFERRSEWPHRGTFVSWVNDQFRAELFEYQARLQALVLLEEAHDKKRRSLRYSHLPPADNPFPDRSHIIPPVVAFNVLSQAWSH